jgi:hypothetical protein
LEILFFLVLMIKNYINFKLIIIWVLRIRLKQDSRFYLKIGCKGIKLMIKIISIRMMEILASIDPLANLNLMTDIAKKIIFLKLIIYC